MKPKKINPKGVAPLLEREMMFKARAEFIGMDFTTVDVLKEFCDYWTETSYNGRKMRFEKEKTFDIGRRLKRWVKNKETNFGRKSSLDEWDKFLK